MAVAFHLLEPVTEETLLALSRTNPQCRFETTADGELVVSLLTGTQFSFGEIELSFQVEKWNKERRFGRVIPASGGITLPDGAIKGPDTAFVSNERWNALSQQDRGRAFVRMAPTVVFELLTPNDSYTLTVEKIDEYLRTGSQVAVLLDPRDRTVRVHRQGGDTEIFHDPDALVLGDEMPGFALDARAVFNACSA